MTEQDAISAVLSGQTERFSEIYDSYIKKIYDFLYARTLHKPTAEDLTSQVFFKAYKNLFQYKPNKIGVGPWLYGIARNTLIDHFRQNKTELPIETVYDLSSDSRPEVDTDQQIRKEHITKLLNFLSPKHKQIVLLRLWEGLSHQEIAQALNISEASSKTEFFRAIKSLKEHSGGLMLAFILLTKF